MTNRDAFLEKLERFFETPQDHLDEQTRRKVLSSMINDFAQTQQRRAARKQAASNAMFWVGVSGIPLSIFFNLEKMMEIIGWGG
jgi:hypothetical protein